MGFFLLPFGHIITSFQRKSKLVNSQMTEEKSRKCLRDSDFKFLPLISDLIYTGLKIPVRIDKLRGLSTKVRRVSDF